MTITQIFKVKVETGPRSFWICVAAANKQAIVRNERNIVNLALGKYADRAGTARITIIAVYVRTAIQV